MNQTLQQLFRFVVSGLISTVADLSVYLGCLNVLAFSYDISKGLSFLVGTTTAFFLNKFWTFDSAHGDMREVRAFVILYACTFFVNVGTNHLVLSVTPTPSFGGEELVVYFAYVCATGASMILNFVGQKLWVFKSRELA